MEYDWGIIGGILGVVGGIIGVYADFKKAVSPAEKKFVFKAAVIIFVVVCLYLVGIFSLPHRFRIWLFIPYLITLFFLINFLRGKQADTRNTSNEKS